MRLRFYLLDVSYEIHGGVPAILLWGVSDDGRRVLVIDKSFRPYFYAILEEGVRESDVISKIKLLSRGDSPVISAEVSQKKYFGKPVRVVKVVTVKPEAVREYREHAKKVRGVVDVVEADIRFSMRYVLDNNVPPCQWYEADVEPVEGVAGYRVSSLYGLVGRLKPLDIAIPPKLRVLALDIEVYNPRGAVNPSRDPVIVVSMATSDGDFKLLTALDGPQPQDRELIREFVNYVLTYDPDIVVGYNSGRFDLPYLVERADKLGLNLDIGRVRGGIPRPSVHGHYSIPGRLHVDLYDFAEEIPEIKVKSLDAVADYLGVVKRSERTLIPGHEIFKYWDDRSRRGVLLKYARDDVVSTLKLSEKFLPFAMQLSSLTGLPLDQVGAASVGYRLEWYLMRSAVGMNELIPNRVEREYEPYRGAIVLEPKKGVHDNIAVLDFTSMYPNIMIKFNIGPDTYVEEASESCYRISGTSYCFRKEPPGFYKSVLDTLLRLRKTVREEMRKHSPDSPEYLVLSERQRALKILANAAYGYMGWVGARWYFKLGAEAVTAVGRNIIERAISVAKNLGLEVIYGDTDSIFVSNKPEVAKFLDEVMRELELEIKVDKTYKRVFFTEAKKRYVGILDDGRIDIVGFEAVRGDWSEIAKEVQENVAKIVLETGDVKKAVDYVKNVVIELKQQKISLEKLVIWKTITKSLDEYEVSAPHVAAAKKMVGLGFKVEKGSKIGYVIIRGQEQISSRSIPYFIAKPSDIDVDYYVKHQIIPAALRILEYFGITEKQLETASKTGKTLLDFK
ncbi:MAG: DNA polymerase II [Sulfolobales archaeon]|nr:DNA polymerase II [Sulfolobales archaeon]MDW8082188.1 DNA polymerase II [Sulfolobales archaeon]